jgi:hypothetical protein
MKRVVIGIENGKPYVISKTGKVEVVFKTEKRRTFTKVIKTWAYHIRTFALGK